MTLIEVLDALDIDSAEVLRRFGNNENLLNKFLGKFSGDHSFKMLSDAVSSNDHQGIEMYAHTLKGVSANFGMNKLSGVCSRMVEDVRQDKYDEVPGLFEEIKAEYEKIITVLKQLD